MYGGTIKVVVTVQVTCDNQNAFEETGRKIVDKISYSLPRKRIGTHKERLAKIQHIVVARQVP